VNAKTIVSIIRCENYEDDCVNSAVKEAIDLAELTDSFSECKNILLKPNLLSTRRPEEAVTTHPSIVKAVAKIAIKAQYEVTLGDSPSFAGENQSKYDRLCEVTGMTSIARELGIPITRFETEIVSATNPNGRFYKSFEVSKKALESDLLVNIPKLKTHGLTTYSGAVKNIFGCIPGVRKGLFHVQSAEDRIAFAQMLVDLLSVFMPTVNIMDAVVGMEGEGPNSGNPHKLGLVMASSDPVALDAVACAIIGIEPLDIHTTRLAHEQGLGCGDLSGIDIRGESIQNARVHDFKRSSGRNQWDRIPSPIRRVLRKQLVAAPVVKSSECVGCADCSRVCPISAIDPGKPPKIDLAKCIRCYCCNEVCNYSAIDLRRGWVGELAFRRLRKK